MSFTFTEDQRLLAESADRFVENEYDFSARREAMALDGGFSRETWNTFAELGWLALPLPGDCDGLGGSTVDVAARARSTRIGWHCCSAIGARPVRRTASARVPTRPLSHSYTGSLWRLQGEKR